MEKKLGQIIARRGGDSLRLSRTEGDKRYGHVVLEDGTVSPELIVDSVLSRGYWKPVSATESLKSYIKALENGPRK
jgi:hypothetical protein